MTPHYDWTPASEPPDTDREVVAWITTLRDWRALRYQAEYWRYNGIGLFDGAVTHWRDIEPPKESAE